MKSSLIELLHPKESKPKSIISNKKYCQPLIQNKKDMIKDENSILIRMPFITEKYFLWNNKHTVNDNFTNNKGWSNQNAHC